MKVIIAAIVTCLVLFAASFGASKFLLTPAVPDETLAEELAQQGDQPKEGEEEKEGPKPPPMQVGVRPEGGVSIEAVLQMSDSIRKMEEDLIGREKRVLKKEQRVKLLFDDLATEQDELTAFSQGIDAKIETLDRLTKSIRTSLDELEVKKAELDKLSKTAGTDDESLSEEMDSKVNQVKGWFENLEAEQAADYLKEFANDGKISFAASLLQKMPDRQKSKILSAMDDPVLVGQLIEALKIEPKKP